MKKILDLALKLERESTDGNFSDTDLNQLKKYLSELESSANSQEQKLGLIRNHLHPQMSLRHFVNFMVPMERAMGRSLKDEEFLVTSMDASRGEKNIMRLPLYFILDNIRSAFNVGSIFRSADGVGVSEIFLCGYTPTPENLALQKTSLGSSEFVSWSVHLKAEDVIQKLQNKKIKIVALETATNSKSIYDNPVLPGPTAFLVGNERFGLEPKILALADEVRHIPLQGYKNSLNVSSALTVAAFEWKRTWK